MLLGFLLFGAPLGLSGLLAATLVGAGVALYARPPRQRPSGEEELKIV